MRRVGSVGTRRGRGREQATTTSKFPSRARVRRRARRQSGAGGRCGRQREEHRSGEQCDHDRVGQPVGGEDAPVQMPGERQSNGCRAEDRQQLDRGGEATATARRSATAFFGIGAKRAQGHVRSTKSKTEFFCGESAEKERVRIGIGDSGFCQRGRAGTDGGIGRKRCFAERDLRRLCGQWPARPDVQRQRSAERAERRGCPGLRQADGDARHARRDRGRVARRGRGRHGRPTDTLPFTGVDLALLTVGAGLLSCRSGLQGLGGRVPRAAGLDQEDKHARGSTPRFRVVSRRDPRSRPPPRTAAAQARARHRDPLGGGVAVDVAHARPGRCRDRARGGRRRRLAISSGWTIAYSSLVLVLLATRGLTAPPSARARSTICGESWGRPGLPRSRCWRWQRPSAAPLATSTRRSGSGCSRPRTSAQGGSRSTGERRARLAGEGLRPTLSSAPAASAG